MFKTYFLDVVTKHYVDFSGRATRKQFWLYTLIVCILYVILAGLSTMDNAVGTFFGVLYGVLGLALFLPGLAISVRRLHDIGRSGWWYLLFLVPLIGPLVLLIFFVTPSKN